MRTASQSSAAVTRQQPYADLALMRPALATFLRAAARRSNYLRARFCLASTFWRTKTMARTPLIAGNWKLNLDHLEATHTVQKLAWLLRDAKHDFSDVEVAVLASFTSIRSVQTLVDADQLELKYGAQDISAHESGAFTGEVSGAQLSKLGVSY